MKPLKSYGLVGRIVPGVSLKVLRNTKGSTGVDVEQNFLHIKV